MKRFRFFKGLPVRRMKRAGSFIVLTFVSPTKYQAGKQLRITQAEWDNFGEWKAVSSVSKVHIRKLVPVDFYTSLKGFQE